MPHNQSKLTERIKLISSLLLGWATCAQALTIGQKAPSFAQLAEERATNRAVIVLFVGAKCPYSRAYEKRIAQLATQWPFVSLLAIDPNADESEAEIARRKLPFFVLRDPEQRLADAFGATKTPEAYLIGKDGKLAYHGRIDDDTEGTEIHRQDLKLAVDEYLASGKVKVAETRAFGCGIVRK